MAKSPATKDAAVTPEVTAEVVAEAAVDAANEPAVEKAPEVEVAPAPRQISQRTLDEQKRGKEVIANRQPAAQ